MSFQDELVKKAGVRGKTKDELASALGVGHSYVSRNVNDLVEEGRLHVVGQKQPQRGRPATLYGNRPRTARSLNQ